MTTEHTQRAFEKGQHCALRPVLAADLAELARIMSQNPCRRRPSPATATRLRKKFEDEKGPGFWSESEKYYSIIDSAGRMAGLIEESHDQFMGMHFMWIHVDDSQPLRSAIGPEALALYLRYLSRWKGIEHLKCEVLEVETDKAAWLSSAGFELELRMERAELYRGRPTARCAWGYMSEELRARPAWSEGEPDYSRASRPPKE